MHSEATFVWQKAAGSCGLISRGRAPFNVHTANKAAQKLQGCAEGLGVHSAAICSFVVEFVVIFVMVFVVEFVMSSGVQCLRSVLSLLIHQGHPFESESAASTTYTLERELPTTFVGGQLWVVHEREGDWTLGICPDRLATVGGDCTGGITDTQDLPNLLLTMVRMSLERSVSYRDF